MGSTNSIPVVSQVKSAVQAIAGDVEGAEETQKIFLDTCAGVSQVKSLLHWVAGDTEAAERTQLKFLENIEGMIDAVPVVGHVKGGVHLMLDDKEKGFAALKSASGTVFVVPFAVLGSMAGPAGGAAAAVAASNAYDGLVTGLDTLANGCTKDGKIRYHGKFKAYSSLLDGKISAGEVFDLLAETTADGIGGANPKPGKGIKRYAKAAGKEIVENVKPKYWPANSFYYDGSESDSESD